MCANTVKKLFWLTFYCLPLIAYAADFTDPRVSDASPQTKANFSPPVKVIIYKSRRTEVVDIAGNPDIPAGAYTERPTRREVKAYVQRQAMEYGVNPALALWIVKHESNFNPRAKGDGEASRGLWQISRIYHPEVSDGAAFDIASSTDWSLQRIRAGKVNEWSTYRLCRNLYENCPLPFSPTKKVQ